LIRGFHSALTYERISIDKNDGVVVECIIPKGSTYFTSISDLAVSNQLIVVKVIKNDLDN